jgi:CAAX prenyl protease-like protein
MAANPSADHTSTPTGHSVTPSFWLAYILPFVIFIALTSLEPKPPEPGAAAGLIPYSYYPAVYSLKIVCTLAAALWALPTLLTSFPPRIHWSSLIVGAVGTVIWVGITNLGLEPQILGALGWSSLGARSAYDPFAHLGGQTTAAYGFLAVRFLGLAVVVPVIEEVFLRGFLMRYVIHPNWWAVPFGTVNVAAIVAGTLFPVLSHPAELLAAAVWFSGITWWMVRTKNLWDCVTAHATTNLLLGIYVVCTGEWQFL